MPANKRKPASSQEQPSLLEKFSEVAAVVKTDIVAGASAVGHTVAGKFAKVKKAIQKKIAAKAKTKKKTAKKAVKKTAKKASAISKKKTAKPAGKIAPRKPVPKKKSPKQSRKK